MSQRVTQNQWRAYLARANELGFSAMAAAPAGPVKAARTVRGWVEAGHHADMHWYARGLDKRCNPDTVLPGVRSVVVLTAPYHPEPVQLAGKHLARYACGDDYHDVLLKRLRTLVAEMAENFPGASFRPYVDTGPVLERYWAQQAGLGWIGKNGNLISRKEGSYLFLASLLTDLEVPYGQPHAGFCGNCRACLDACPTDAFPAPGLVDSRRCISYLNIEHRGEFPENTPGFADWIFGCDICQEVCPWQKFSPPTQFHAFLPRTRYDELTPDAILAMVQEDFSTTFRKSPIKRTKMAGIKRNIHHLKEAVIHG